MNQVKTYTFDRVFDADYCNKDYGKSHRDIYTLERIIEKAKEEEEDYSDISQGIFGVLRKQPKY